MKTIYILLTRSTTILSRIVHFITEDDYTHVSISFEKTLQPLYSSSRKNGRTLFPAGPCKESFYRGYLKKHREIPCAIYELRVSDEIYEMAKKEVARIMEHADKYHFNIIGLILCQFNIPFVRKRYFFCSQFVCEILKRSNALTIGKDSSLMRPSDYMKLPELRCCFRGHLRDIVEKNNIAI